MTFFSEIRWEKNIPNNFLFAVVVRIDAVTKESNTVFGQTCAVKRTTLAS